MAFETHVRMAMANGVPVGDVRESVRLLFETLDEPFRLHIGIARVAGATEEQIRAVLHLVAEYGMGKTWRALAALIAHLG